MIIIDQEEVDEIENLEKLEIDRLRQVKRRNM